MFLGFDDITGDKNADDIQLMYEDATLNEDEAGAKDTFMKNMAHNHGHRTPNIDEGELRSAMGLSRMSGAASDKNS